ncbi:MAG: hypothetical protein ACU0CT_02490 [Paracoccaceae bacterium]
MSSRKKQKRQQKAQERQKLRQATHAYNKGEQPVSGPEIGLSVESSRPTSERKSRGTWAEPSGMGKHERPVVDLASDEIGRLFQAGRITGSQEQAARQYQELRAAYISELPDVRGFKSCLAGSVPGYDDSMGNPEVIAAWRKLDGRLSHPQRREMLLVCDMGERPRSIDVLRAALDAIGG